MNGNVRILYEEHKTIVSAIDLLKEAGKLLPGDVEKYEEITRALISFFRNYADKYHHFKEEDILFPEMGRKNDSEIYKTV